MREDGRARPRVTVQHLWFQSMFHWVDEPSISHQIKLRSTPQKQMRKNRSLISFDGSQGHNVGRWRIVTAVPSTDLEPSSK